MTSLIASRSKEDPLPKKNNFWIVVSFLLAKLFAYTILGFALGWFGQKISLSDSIRIKLQIIAGLYMVVVGLDLLKVHPIFRYFILQPPKFLGRLLRNRAKSQDIFAPAILGLLTIFIPCGTTLAMEALSISSGSPWQGGLILASFVLGTFPLFIGIGYLALRLSEMFQKSFFKIAGVLVLYLGITSINGSFIAAGLPFNIQSLLEASPIQIELPGTSAPEDPSLPPFLGGYQIVNIAVLRGNYNPNYIKVRHGYPIKLTLSASNVYSCALAFRLPTLGLGKNLRPTDQQTIEISSQQIGKIPFSCSMGMYRGMIEVI